MGVQVSDGCYFNLFMTTGTTTSSSYKDQLSRAKIDLSVHFRIIQEMKIYNCPIPFHFLRVL